MTLAKIMKCVCCANTLLGQLRVDGIRAKCKQKIGLIAVVFFVEEEMFILQIGSEKRRKNPTRITKYIQSCLHSRCFPNQLFYVTDSFFYDCIFHECNGQAKG